MHSLPRDIRNHPQPTKKCQKPYNTHQEITGIAYQEIAKTIQSAPLNNHKLQDA